jgi:hypothetical protein
MPIVQQIIGLCGVCISCHSIDKIWKSVFFAGFDLFDLVSFAFSNGPVVLSFSSCPYFIMCIA